MTDYHCTLAKVYDPDKHDIMGWMMSEKLDGVRALWRSHEGLFVSRSNKPLNIPGSWWDMMNKIKVPLDGEFFMGRGRFQDTVSAVRKKAPTEADFKDVKYVVFDLVRAGMPAVERLLLAQMHVGKVKDSRIFVLNHDVVTSGEMVGVHYAAIMASEGEGLMFRDPKSMYEFKRSGNLLKMKGCIDGKAIVVAIASGEGKHEGRMGALHVVDVETGVRFKIGTGFTDDDRQWWWDNEPARKSIRWKAMELTRDGVPRFPVFVCIDEGD